MSLIRQFAIRNELLYSGLVLPNVQIFFVQKISFATFRRSIDDFLRDTLVLATAYFRFDCYRSSSNLARLKYQEFIFVYLFYMYISQSVHA